MFSIIPNHCHCLTLCLYFSQRSLTCLGSVLTLRPIPDLLEAPTREVSITATRETQEPSSTSLSSGSSSEYDEADDWNFFQQASQEDEDDLEEEDEYDPYAPKRPTSEEQDEEELLIGEMNVQRGPLVIPMRPPTRVTTVLTPEPIGLERRDSGSPLYISEGEEGLAGGTPIPRRSLIKSNFYCSSEQLSPMSARHMMLRDKIQARRQERGRKPLRASLSGRLNEPLIEYVEDSPDLEAKRKAAMHSSMLKSSSFDSGVSGAHPNIRMPRRSRSLDAYTQRSLTEQVSQGEDERDVEVSHKPDLTDEEEKSQGVEVKSKLRRRSPVSPRKRPAIKARTQIRESIEGSRVGDSQSQIKEKEAKHLDDDESTAGSQLSLLESRSPERGSQASSRLGSYEELASSRHPVMAGKTSPCSLLQDSEDEDMENVLRSLRQDLPQAPPRHRTNSSSSGVNQTRTTKSNIPLRRSSSAVPVRAATADTGNKEVLQRHASAPALQAKPPKSSKAGFMKIFRKHSWTSHSSPQLESSEKKQDDGASKPRTPLLTLRKKMGASASSLTKLFTRQSSKEDAERKKGCCVLIL